MPEGKLRPVDNPGFRRMFRPDELTLGICLPIEAGGARPSLENQIATVRRAENGGFGALWVRDIPLLDPTSNDLRQVFDPWVHLGYLAALTKEIALATGAIVLPLRHPVHTAKAAASVDSLSGGRLVFGVGTGNRPVELAAFNADMEKRAELFREHLRVFRTLLVESLPVIESSFGVLKNVALVPKPFAPGIPTMATGRCLQDLDWIAQHSDGWINYPRSADATEEPAQLWRAAVERIRPGEFMPYAQTMYVDLDEDAYCPPSPIHLGFRLGRRALVDHLHNLCAAGVNHVMLDLKACRRPGAEVVDELAELVIPQLT